MQIDIRADVKVAAMFLDEVHKRHVPFAAVYAATLTARDVKAAEQGVMARVFDRPTPYVMNALAVKPATKRDFVASVEFKEFAHKGTPAKRFLNPHIQGGGRSQKSSERRLAALMGSSSFLVPGRNAPVNGYGNVRGSYFTRVLSQLKVSSDSMQNASNSRRSKAKRKASAFFIPKKGGAIYERKGTDVKPVLIFTRQPRYSKRFPFYETAAATVDRTFGLNFKKAFESAVATSNYKGKWR